MRLISKHWHGNLALWVSFWLIGVMPLVLIRVAEPHWFKVLPLDKGWAVPAVLAYAAVVLFVLFPWQAVGVLRSAYKHFEQFGKSHILYSVQAAVIAAGIAAASHGLYTVQRLTGLVDQYRLDSQIDENRPVIQVSDSDKSLLLITGELKFGVTKEVRKALGYALDVKTVVLESGGGQIYEGRGLALLFRENGLNTHVNAECSSSCTTAFIGGVKRSLSTNAKLGFHQYGLDANRPRQASKIYDTESEQVRDAELFLEQGVDASFTDEMFNVESNDMWYPSSERLLGAGVVHVVVSHPRVGGDP